MLVDHYSNEWMWWVRAHGAATIQYRGEAMRTAYDLLRTKYPQYQSVRLDGPVITMDVHGWSHRPA